VPKIEVTFDIDADGIVHCSARDFGSGIKHSVTIQRSTGLSPDEVEAYKREAEEFSEQDRVTKERISSRVQAQSLCAEAERTVTKYGERVERSHVDKVMRAVELVKEALERDSGDDLRPLIAGLDVSLLDLGRAIHSGNRRMDSPEKPAEKAAEKPPVDAANAMIKNTASAVSDEIDLADAPELDLSLDEP
jgi:molecular chaperone DnaK